MNTLLRLIGFDDAECERRKEFLGIDEEDRGRLSSLAGLFETVADGMVDTFYEHVLAFPETARFLMDPEIVTRLKSAQKRHFIQLCSGVYDADYFESRLRVGLAHARIGLQPHLYLGGYLIQLTYVKGRLEEHFGDDLPAAAACLGSLHKIILLDIALATEAYIYCGFVERTTADTSAYEAAIAQEALDTRLREEAKREELLRMVAHDIRSPVAAMMATARAGLRKYRNTSESPGKQFALVEATGQNVLQIIDDTVSHARAPGGELPVSPEAFDVSGIVAECAAQLMPFAQQTAHVLSLRELEPVQAMALDRVLVRRVVSNLIMNACRHTPAGSRVEVECRVDGEWCRIVIADDGPGFPPLIRSALVDETPFPPGRDRGPAVDSGLGLPFCRLACERMGGRLLLQDGDLRGSRVLVLLPLGGH